MKTHGFYWYVRCVAQPSGILAAGMTITRGAIPNCVTGSQQQPPGSGAPQRITEGTLCTPDNAQRQLHERALQTAPLLHGVTNPPGWKGWRRGLSRERGAPPGKPWQGLAEAWSGARGTRKISLQNSDTPPMHVLEARLFKGFLSDKIDGFCVCFCRMGTAQDTSVTITNSNSKARDTGVSKSSYKMMMIIFCMAKQHIFP